jgi:hypothetical protein
MRRRLLLQLGIVEHSGAAHRREGPPGIFRIQDRGAHGVSDQLDTLPPNHRSLNQEACRSGDKY